MSSELTAKTVIDTEPGGSLSTLVSPRNEAKNSGDDEQPWRKPHSTMKDGSLQPASQSVIRVSQQRPRKRSTVVVERRKVSSTVKSCATGTRAIALAQGDHEDTILSSAGEWQIGSRKAHEASNMASWYRAYFQGMPQLWKGISQAVVKERCRKDADCAKQRDGPP